MTTDVEIEVKYIPMGEVFADEEFNCRGKIIPRDVVDLASDIKTNGLLQPVVVTPLAKDHPKRAEGYKWQLVAGFRRHMAHKINEAGQIQASIKKGLDEATARIMNISENIQRKDLNILQEARAIQKLKDLGISQADCGERLNTSRGWAQVRYMLLDLPDPIQQACADGVITTTQIRELHTILNKYGEQACFDAAKTIKEAKVKGKSAVIDPNRKKTTSKRQRKKGEVFQMQEEVHRVLKGNCLATRALAWAAGEITTYDMLDSLREEAAKVGIPYQIPEEF